MAVVTYDPSTTTVTLGGQLLSGYAPDTFITAEYRGNDYKIIRGSEGESTRTMSLDRSGVVTVTLLATSGSNATLNAYANADRAGGLGIFDLLINDYNAGLTIHGAKAWVQKPAPYAAGPSVAPRSWVIHVQEMTLDQGDPHALEELFSLVEGAAQNLYQWATKAL